MELSVVTLWSGFSPIHAELTQYLSSEAWPLPSRFVWVVNTNDPDTKRVVDDCGHRLIAKGHRLDVIECLDKPVDGVMGKHKHIANLYNLALPKLETAVVLVVEDDSLPLPGAYARAGVRSLWCA